MVSAATTLLPRLSGVGLATFSHRRFVERPVAYYRKCSKAWPLSVAFMTCYAKGTFTDLIAQKVVERKEEVNIKRNVAFALWSGCYLGCVQHTVYNVVMTRLFGSSTTFYNAMRKTIAECAVHGPFFYLPFYYFSQDFLTMGSLEGHIRYYDEFWGIYKPYFITWSWFMVLMFTVIPLELRIAAMAGVSCCWSVVLSTISNRSLADKDTLGEESVQEELEVARVADATTAIVTKTKATVDLMLPASTSFATAATLEVA